MRCPFCGTEVPSRSRGCPKCRAVAVSGATPGEVLRGGAYAAAVLLVFLLAFEVLPWLTPLGLTPGLMAGACGAAFAVGAYLVYSTRAGRTRFIRSGKSRSVRRR